MADDFAACVARLQDAAVAAGVTRTVAAAALDHVQSDASVLALAQIKPEFKLPIWDYLGFLVDQQRIDEGRARMQQHAQMLRAAEQHYGVNRYVLTAIWGVETDYGNTTGKHFLPQALATLVCARDRRAGFWRSERSRPCSSSRAATWPCTSSTAHGRAPSGRHSLFRRRSPPRRRF